jgi:hypothetical protein
MARGDRPRQRGGSTRWQLGRIVRVSLEAACGFIRDSAGELVYFGMEDVVAGPGELRAGARVRYKPAGSGIPRAREVTRV